MFGNHGRKEQGYEGNIQTRGGLMYYQTDDLGNVMDVTDHTGDTVMKYRYDAFGNLFTQMAAPYNTIGYTSKSYDAKASLMDYSARWYSPTYGRFITEDTFLGWMDEPLSLNKYSYVHNNPINHTDPTGHYMPGDDDLPQDIQNQIHVHTEEWNNATTQEERDAAHAAAEAIRQDYYDSLNNGGGGGTYTPTIEEQIAQRDGNLDAAAGERAEGKVEDPNLKTAFISAVTGPDIVLGGYIAGGASATTRAIANKTYKTPISNSLSKKEAYKKMFDVAEKADKYRSISDKLTGKPGIKYSGVKSVGTKLGVAGAIAGGGIQIASDLLNNDYSKSDKAKAVTVDVVQTGATAGSVALISLGVGLLIPGVGLGIAAGIVTSLAVGTLINISAQFLKNRWID